MKKEPSWPNVLDLSDETIEAAEIEIGMEIGGIIKDSEVDKKTGIRTIKEIQITHVSINAR